MNYCYTLTVMDLHLIDILHTTYNQKAESEIRNFMYNVHCCIKWQHSRCNMLRVFVMVKLIQQTFLIE